MKVVLGGEEQAEADDVKTLADSLNKRAAEEPEGTAFTFLLDGELEQEVIAYGELRSRALALAGRIREAVPPRSHVLLLFPPGIDYVVALFACFYARVVGVSSYPPHPKHLERTLTRLLGIAEDSQTTAVLASTQILAARSLLPDDHPMMAVAWIAEGGADTAAPTVAELGEPALDDVAFLQYTSGSTAAPRGVALTHRNLLDNSAAIAQIFGHSRSSRGFIWLPPYHDMGLIGGILQPIYCGFPCVLMSPLAAIKRPERWLEGISRHRATTSGGPNFAYDLCVRKHDPGRLASLDLSSWEVAFNGAEPISPRTIRAFEATFAPSGFRETAFTPCYGLAEATLMVSCKPRGSQPSIRAVRIGDADRDGGKGHQLADRVSCGTPIPGHEVAIVNPDLHTVLQPGETGEIWVSGASVAAGYWRRPDDNALTFAARLAEDERSGPYLRTGDLGFLKDGELFVVGRLKELFILKGRNYFPHDLEEQAEDADGRLRPHSTAAFTVASGDRDPTLAVVGEVSDGESGRDLEESVRLIRRAIVEGFDLQVRLVALCRRGSVPKTTSGKIQRGACRRLLENGGLDVVFEWHSETGLT